MNKIIAMAKDAGMGWPFPLDVCGLSRFRDLVLEEAAKACDNDDSGRYDDYDVEARHLAGVTRAMKGEKP